MDEEVDKPYALTCKTATIKFSPTFSGWVHKQFIIIDDFPYAWMDFRDDPELMFPEGE